MEKKKLVYVIGAYSGDVEGNIKKAEAVSIELIRAGYHVFTPHKNTPAIEAMIQQLEDRIAGEE